jgi:predicted outer membrane repeat protein
MNTPRRRFIALASSIAAPLLVLAFLLFGLPAPAQAANVVVNNCTTANLRAAIDTATVVNGGLVTFNCPGGAHTFTFTQTQVLSHDVTIGGGGVITVSGGDTDRIFSVPSAQKATLLNLTLAHGQSSQGGALSVTGLVVINNVTFLHNASSGFGGAIAVLNLGTANISGSHFFSNTAAANGGAIYSNGELAVDGSFFTQNTAPIGGAIH